ncbi:MAG: hypothetical protein CVU98_09570, partial [Firmicutes bacterium HGW-Firmicutes-3]
MKRIGLVVLMLFCIAGFMLAESYGSNKILDGKEIFFQADSGTQHYLDSEGTLWKWGRDFNTSGEVFINKPIMVDNDVMYYSNNLRLKKDGTLYYFEDKVEKVIVNTESGNKEIKVSKIMKKYIIDDQNNLYWTDIYLDYNYLEKTLKVNYIAKNVVEIIDFESVLAIIDTSRTLWIWTPDGHDEFGLLGNGSIGEYTGESSLNKISEQVSKVVSDHTSIYAITNSGDVLGWGKYSINGNLTPQKVMSNVEEIYFPKNTELFFKMKDNTLHGYKEIEDFATGENNYKLIKVHSNIVKPFGDYLLAQNGDLLYYDQTMDSYKTILKNVKDYYDELFYIYEDDFITEFKHIIVKTDDSLWTAGSNSNGLLGVGLNNSDSYTLENAVKVMTDIKQYYSSGGTTYVLKNDGSFWGWGSNSYGQIGDGTTENKSTPVKIDFADIRMPKQNTYIYDQEDPGASIVLPSDRLESVINQTTAINTVREATKNLTEPQKQSATGTDLITLYAEEAVALSGKVVVEGSNVTLNQ